VLGEQLKAQESRLEELRQHDSSRDEVHKLLQQANKDMVSFQNYFGGSGYKLQYLTHAK
jgi:hypothetical protein